MEDRIKEMEDRIKEMEERRLELEERLLAVVELAKELMSAPNKVYPQADRLVLSDYKDYLRIVEYVESNNFVKITTHQLQRHCLKNRGYRELECMLWNLKRCGLLELTLGNKQYLEVSLIGSSMFEKQYKKNNRDGGIE